MPHPHVKILHGIEGALRAQGTAVIIDVFRFSNTVLALLDRGGEELISVDELEDAYLLKKKHPELVLVGEREGEKPPSFDFNNSPHEVLRRSFEGKRVLITTSAGSGGLIAAARSAEKTVVASFGNARKIADYLRNSETELISLIPLGLKGKEEAEEDTLCALYLIGLLRGIEMDFSSLSEEILVSKGAKRLRSLGQTKDLELCLKPDIFDIVPHAVCKKEYTVIEPLQL